ncbi:MAG: hypothetical protein JW974_02250 [Alphaproteobacteria bacterium]|nr:hypothetical protein [Alphaproteobacteria bacterium]
MAKQIRFFYNKIFVTLFGILVVPLLRLLGIGSDAYGVCFYTSCTLGDTRYVSCGTSYLQKQICSSCTFEAWVCQDGSSNCPNSELVLGTDTGTDWVNSGSCQYYSNQCSLGQTSSTSCTTEVGTGTQTRSCEAIVVGGSTYYMWGSYGACTYTSCAVASDVLDSGKCYCTSSCSMTNGYGTMIAQLRVSSICPVASSSSSSVVP